jgi:predicted cupin superfamily sugar epimerase
MVLIPTAFGILAFLAPILMAVPYSHDRATPIARRSAQEVIDQLQLIPNEEKGYYIQTFQDPDTVNNRSVSTAIYYLLEGSSGSSVWHRVDAVEVWHHYAGAPLTLSLSYDDGQPVRVQVLGPDVFNEQQPQYAIAKSEWQSARSLGEWTLVGTTGEQLLTCSDIKSVNLLIPS